MISRNITGGALSAGFITKLQSRYESPKVLLRLAIETTPNMNEALDDSETRLDVDDNSYFSDNDWIMVDDEIMFVTDATAGANQIDVTRGYGISVAAAHDDNSDIYILDTYAVLSGPLLGFDPELGASDTVVHLSNADKAWNIFLSDRTHHGNIASLELSFDGLSESMYLYRGILDHVEPSSSDMSIYLYLKDRISDKLDEVIDPAHDALTLFQASKNPMDAIWEILVTEGGFDSETSQANLDIDYTKWNACKTKLTAQNLSFSMTIPRSHSYRSAVQTILYLANCHGFITNEGKIGFDYAVNDAVSGDDTWTRDKLLSEVSGGKVNSRVYTDTDNIVNWQKTFHGYDVTEAIWSGTDIDQNTASQSRYGIQSIVEADYVVWHDDLSSAQGGSAWVETMNKDPKIFAELLTWLYGARMEIGDVVDLTDSDYGWSNEYLKIEQVKMNMENFTTQFLTRAAAV